MSNSVPKAAKRTYFTHVALICDDASLQHLLPQVIIGNEYTLKAKSMAALQAKCPTNVFLMRRASSWVNGAVCTQIVRMIADALRDHLPTMQVILMFDVHSAHLQDVMWRACYNGRFLQMLIPARTTKYLQPIDAHIFAVYKLCLQRAYHNLGVTASMSFSTLLDCVCIAIREIIVAREWSNAFASNGFSHCQGGVTKEKLVKLSIDGSIAMSSASPVNDQLKLCFPSSATIVSATVWRGVNKPRSLKDAAGALPTLTSAGKGIAVGPKAKPISTRTRAKTKAAFPIGPSSSTY